MKKVFSLCLCALFIMICFCSCSGEKTRYNVVYTDVFDTVTEFTAYCGSESEFNEAAEAMHAELLRLHKLFDIYNKYEGVENLALINEKHGSAQPAAKELRDIIALGKEYFTLSGGKLNIALGSLLSVWHAYRDKGTGVPSVQELRKAAEDTDINGVSVSADGRISYSGAGTSLDVGAIAKGYASALAAQVIKDCGVTDFALNVGGNVVTSGEKPNGKWTVGVQDPDEGIFTKVQVSGESVVTSGDYQRFY
ncbi:MAG: FAD:protein FMN transferase, partial [Clostridia bacterium]|nr:FAD:protein FMN transferase [Clostridia bacterium]